MRAKIAWQALAAGRICDFWARRRECFRVGPVAGDRRPCSLFFTLDLAGPPCSKGGFFVQLKRTRRVVGFCQNVCVAVLDVRRDR